MQVTFGRRARTRITDPQRVDERAELSDLRPRFDQRRQPRVERLDSRPAHGPIRIRLQAIMGVVSAPDLVEADPLPARRRFYRRTTIPSRWLMVVVRYEQVPARIITAMALRKDPKSWNG